MYIEKMMDLPVAAPRHIPLPTPEPTLDKIPSFPERNWIILQD